VLQSILKDYRGTIMLVSHDRYLIDALATQIWEVLPAQATLRIFGGSYTQYKAVLQLEAENALKTVQQARQVDDKGQPRPAAGLSKSEQKKRQQRLEALEAEISRLEDEKVTITRQLESPSNDGGKVYKLGQDYNRVQEELDARMLEWGELADG
jgi:ATP-binding cassette subfamily F protein 3